MSPAAQLMLKRYSENALEESAAQADELAVAGNDDGATAWRRVMTRLLDRDKRRSAIVKTSSRAF